MNRNDYGQKAEIIGQMTDVNQLMGLLKNPQYAGFTNVIIARLTELNKMKQAPQAQQPPAPTVAQQAVAGQAPPDQPAMARGGIIAFKHGGEVRKFAKGGKTSSDIASALQRYSLNNSDAADPSSDDYSTMQDAFANPTHAGMEHTTGPTPFSNPFSIVDPYQAKLDAAVAAQRAAAKAYSGADEVGGPLPEMLDKEKRQALAARAAGVPAATPYKPITEKQLGLPSLDAASLMAAQRGSGGDGFDPDSFKKYYDAIDALAGKNLDADAQRAEIAKNKKNALNFALMHAGLGMAQSASEHPTYGFAGNLASGAGAGLGAYEKNETEQNAAQRELARLERQEKLGIAGLAIGERGQDVRAARNDAMQRAAIAAQLKGPAMMEARIRRQALYLMNQDKAPPSEYPKYEALALSRVDPNLVGAGIRAATTANTATLTGWNNYNKNNGTNIPFERYQQMIASGHPGAMNAESSGSILGVHPDAQ